MKKRNANGFTLVEVIVGLLVFAILATSASVAFLQTQKLAHSNVMHNTARTVLQGYVEQIKGVQYHKLLEVIGDPVTHPIPTKSISSLTEGEEIQIDDPLLLNVENHKNILLDIIDKGNGEIESHTMDLYVTPTATNIINSAGIEVLEFTFDYRYESLFKGMGTTHDGSVRFIKTSVSEF
jgi:prepilin-type N-terminal cleavage/methylation domain-containing protein